MEQMKIESCYNLGIQLKEQGDLNAAERCFRWVVDHNPTLPDPQHSLGVVLQLQGRLDEAIKHYRTATVLDPDFVKAHYNLATALWRSGCYQEAITSLHATLGCDPNHREAHWLLGMLLLLTGDYARGWQEYEWRWGAIGFSSKKQNYDCPEWDGSQLAGKTLLIHMEQGRGDMLQFIRYAPLSVARGAKVIVCAVPELVTLLATATGVSQSVNRDEPLPDFDVHVPALTLPLVFGTTPHTIPNIVPYLKPDADKVNKWHRQLSSNRKLRVGLAWQGTSSHDDDRNRSCPLNDFQILNDVDGITFYSLQIGHGSEQLEGVSETLTITDFTGELRDFSDTAAFIHNLDLVISVDTAVAHLAGALGKPVWTLLPFVPDWRWLLKREDSPWYPSMRLFRQSLPGDWSEVFARVKHELTLWTGTASYLNKVGTGLLQGGRIAEAEKIFLLATERDPSHAEAHCNRGIALDALHRYEEAMSSYQTAITNKPDYLQALFNMGNTCRTLDDLDRAQACYEQAIELKTNFVPAHLCLGEIYKKRKDFESAKNIFEHVLTIDHDSSDAWQGLAETFQAMEEFKPAVLAYRQALLIKPGRASTLNLLGTVYHCLEQLSQAEFCYRDSLRVAPDRPTVLNNLGTVLNAQGRFQEAVAVLRHLLEIDADNADGHWNLSLALLAIGEYLEGWREYEWRFRKKQPVPKRDFLEPRWDGSPLHGRTILLHCEQGFGDTLQFARYALLVIQRGGRVIIECQVPALKRLLLSLEGVTEVVAAGELLPRFDCHQSLLSLPFLFGTTLETIPAGVPYLAADPGDVEEWRRRMGPPKAFRVGLVWYGRQNQVLNRKRSCPLKNFAPLAAVPNVDFFSLQIGEGVEQLEGHDVGLIIKDFTSYINDFSDTAAFMANLDLVISIDTAVAHLAGAVGTQIWLLLPFGADWRWLHDRHDSPWYPTMRLFQQSAVGEWTTVMTSVVAALNKVSMNDQVGQGLDAALPLRSSALPKPVVETPGYGMQGCELFAVESTSAMRVGLAWSGRQDNPLNRKRSCPFSALTLLLNVPNVTFFSLQLGEADEGAKDDPRLIDLTGHIRNFEDTAALMTSLDLIISIDSAVAHLAGALGRPTWVLLPHVADWRWLRNREDSPWYPSLRLFRQPDFGDWKSVIQKAACLLAQLAHKRLSWESRSMTVCHSMPGPSQERMLLEQVLERHRETLAANPSNPDTHLDVGAALALLGRYEDAATSFRRVLHLDPENVAGHLNLAYSLLAQEEYKEGWHHFEWRLRKIPFGQLPPWPMLRQENFGTHRNGTSLLVHCEQGYGDTIQFSRFLPMLADAGYRVVVSCQPPLVPLVATISGVCQVVPHGEILPACDLQMLLLSLPGFFSITQETLPARIPYLVPSSLLVSEWSGKLDKILR